jgi:hypothetical protein
MATVAVIVMVTVVVAVFAGTHMDHPFGYIHARRMSHIFTPCVRTM